MMCELEEMQKAKRVRILYFTLVLKSRKSRDIKLWQEYVTGLECKPECKGTENDPKNKGSPRPASQN